MIGSCLDQRVMNAERQHGRGDEERRRREDARTLVRDEEYDERPELERELQERVQRGAEDVMSSLSALPDGWTPTLRSYRGACASIDIKRPALA